MRLSWIILILSIVLAIINTLVIFISSAFVKIRLKIDKTDVNGITALSISNIVPIYKVKVRHIPKKLTDTEKDKIRNERAFRDMVYCRSELWDLYKYIRPRVVLHSMLVEGKIGVDDAYYTAILAPTVSIAVYNIVFNCFRNFDSTPIINISPDFDSISAKGEISCIFKLKIAHSIIVLIKMFKIFMKSRKRRKIISQT